MKRPKPEPRYHGLPFDPLNPQTANVGWRASNEVIHAMRHLIDIVRDQMLVMPPRTRFCRVHGPSGLFKSGLINQLLTGYHLRVEAEWMELTAAQRLAGDWWPRRTHTAPSGMQTFRSPIVIFPQHCEEKECWLCMWDCQHEGEIGLIDDSNCMNFKRNRALIQGCTSGRGEAERRTPKEYTVDIGKSKIEFRGSLLTTDNTNPDSAEGRRRLVDQFGRALYDRAEVVKFPFDPDPIAEYIHNVAFPWAVAAGGTGTPDQQELSGEYENLFQFLFRAQVDSGDPGVNFSCSQEQAIEIIEDVRRYFATNWHDMEVIGFRDLQRWVKYRALYPDDWRNRAKLSLRKRKKPTE